MRLPLITPLVAISQMVAAKSAPLRDLFHPFRRGNNDLSTQSALSSGCGESAPPATAKTMWTFRDPCDSMEWTELPEVEMEVIIATAAQTRSAALDEDLILVGVFAPAKKPTDTEAVDGLGDGGEGGNVSDDNESLPTAELTGRAKDLDEDLGGLLLRVMDENAKAFRGGAVIGATTPVVRVSNCIGEDGSATVRDYILLLSGLIFYHQLLCSGEFSQP